MAQPNSKYPPGPRDRLSGITFYAPLKANPLGFAIRTARDFGDFAYVPLAWVNLYLVNRPELIREVLSTKVKSFRKLEQQMRSLRKIEGEGLVVSDGAIWARHRPVVQGSFHASHFRQYAETIVDYTIRRLQDWRSGASFDLATEMNELALEIIAKLVFDVDLASKARELRDAVHRFRSMMQKEVGRPFLLPDWLPTPGRIRQRRALQVMNDLLWRYIREHRSSTTKQNDILAQMLAAASAVHPNDPLTDAEIRDEAATLFVAGHDTTSAALAWFWYVLTQNPHIEAQVVHEIDAVLGDRPPTSDDFRRLHYLEMVVKESMRLFPAAGFLFGREALEDVELGGYRIRRGSWLMISPYVVHHDARNFHEPDRCDPERFSVKRIDAIPPYAYIPFGGGPRICIGNNLAMMQIILLTATVLQQFRIELDQGPPEMELEIVLRPKNGLRAKAISRRKLAHFRKAV